MSASGSRQPVEELRLDGGRLLADDARERRALGSVSLARRAQAAEQMHLQTVAFASLSCGSFVQR
jgi:hypothetical protein